MGMRLQYNSVPPGEFDRLRNDPNLAASAIMDSELEGMPPGALEMINQQLRAAGMTQMFPRLVRPDDEVDNDDRGHNNAGGGSSIGGPNPVRGELEKAWHGLHFIFTGVPDEAPPPFGYLLSGGEEIGADLGYGAARLLQPKEVIAFRNALKGISDKEFDRRFDLKAMERNQIYPGIWDEDRDDLLEEYRMYFEQLKNDLDATVTAGAGLLISIT